MIKINKFNKSIKDLEIGSILYLTELFTNEKSGFVNDCIIGFIELNDVKREMKLWIRHLQEETELPDGDIFSEWLIKTEKDNLVYFPEKLILIGMNKETNRMIVKPYDTK